MKINDWNVNFDEIKKRENDVQRILVFKSMLVVDNENALESLIITGCMLCVDGKSIATCKLTAINCRRKTQVGSAT